MIAIPDETAREIVDRLRTLADFWFRDECNRTGEHCQRLADRLQRMLNDQKPKGKVRL